MTQPMTYLATPPRSRPARRLWRLLAALLTLAAVQVAAAAPAAAHAVLQQSDPAQNASLDAPPRAVTLTFNESVEVSIGAIQVLDAAGNRVDRGKVTHPGGQGNVIQVQLQDGLGTGGYAVGYRVVSADSHPIVGAYTFGVGGGSGEEASALADELLAGEGGDPAVGAVYTAVRWLSFASLALLVGATAFVLMIWRDGRGHPRVRALLWGAWAVQLASTLLSFPLQGLYVSGLGGGSALDPELLSAVAGTRFGLVNLARVGLLLLVIPALLALGRPAPAEGTRAQGWSGSYAEDAMLLLALGLLLTPGLAGHAGTGYLVPLALVTDVVHLAAVAVWLGGLVMLAAVVLPRRQAAELRRVVPRFSSVAFAAVVAVVVSGAVQGWRQVGTVDGLLTTTYGRLLLTKVVGVGFLIGLGWLSRQVVNRRLRTAPLVARPAGPGAQLANPDTETVARLRRSVGIEVVIAAVVLALAALLVNAVPARSGSASFDTVAPGAPGSGAFGASIKAGQSTVIVTVNPARVGANEIHFSILDANSQLADIPGFSATLELPARNLPPFELELEKLGPGHFAAYDARIPIAGTYELAVTVRSSDIDEDVGTTEMLVRR